MEDTRTTFEKIMENAPFLKALIQDKITEEVGKKDVEISTLKEENVALFARVEKAEQLSIATGNMQQELIDLLVEGEVI